MTTNVNQLLNINLAKPTMVIDYLVEDESSEKSIPDYAEEIGIKVNENNPYNSFNFVEKENGLGCSFTNGEVISIEEMQKFIAKAKKKGATHLNVFHHGDHRNYNLYALRFRLATESELKKIKEAQGKEKMSEIDEINKQIEKLQKAKSRIAQVNVILKDE